MSLVANAVLLLGRYADCLVILGILPVISHMKFGKLLHAQEQALKSRRTAAERKDNPDAHSHSQPIPFVACAPPAWALLLLVFAEFSSSLQLFDQSDKQVRRAFGEVIRLQKSSGKGITETLEALEKLLGNTDVYEVFRFFTMCAGFGSLLLTVAFGLEEADAQARESPIAALKRSAKNAVHFVVRPRLWFLVALFLSYTVGNWTAISRLCKRTSTSELFVAAAPLFRAIASAGTIIGTPHTGPLPSWACFHGIGAMARFTRVLMYERASIAMLINLSTASSTLTSVRGTLALEAWTVLMLLPCAAKSARARLLIPILATPCIALAMGGSTAAMIEPYLEVATQRVSMCVSILSLMLVFLGGFSTMIVFMALAQAILHIHSLSTMKA